MLVGTLVIHRAGFTVCSMGLAVFGAFRAVFTAAQMCQQLRGADDQGATVNFPALVLLYQQGQRRRGTKTD